MMRKLALILICCLFVLPVQAQEHLNRLTALAAHFPAETPAFVAFRMDEALFDMLDAYYVNASVAMQIPAMSVRDTLQVSLRGTGLEVDAILAMLGDYGAIGMDTNNQPVIILEIADRAAVGTLITTLSTTMPMTTTEQGAFTVYTRPAYTNGATTSIVALSDNLLIFTYDSFDLAQLGTQANLADSATFTTTLAQLPKPEYQFLGYVDAPALLNVMGDGGGVIDAATVGAFAFGMTNLDEVTIALDTVQMPGVAPVTGAPATIDPMFTRFIPEDVSGVIQATNLANLIEQLQNGITLITPQGQPNPGAQLEGLLAVAGLDLDEDILSWTTGDYALFFESDIVPLYRNALTSQSFSLTPTSDGVLQFGVAIEATDAAKAAGFVAKLDTLLNGAASTAEGVTLTLTEIAGKPATAIDIVVQDSGAQTGLPLDIELHYVLGATDEIVYLLPRAWADNIFSSSAATITNNPIYQAALSHALPDATVLMYGDGQGMLVGTASVSIVFLAAIGPAVGDAFNNIVDDLQASSLPTNNPRQAMIQDGGMMQQQITQIENTLRLLRSASVSAQMTADGVTRMRFVQTINLANQ